MTTRILPPMLRSFTLVHSPHLRPLGGGVLAPDSESSETAECTNNEDKPIPAPTETRSPMETCDRAFPNPPKQTCWKVLVTIYIYIYMYDIVYVCIMKSEQPEPQPQGVRYHETCPVIGGTLWGQFLSPNLLPRVL